MKNFKVGDRVCWYVPDHTGSLWHGKHLAPQGYRITDLRYSENGHGDQVEAVKVEDIDGTPIWGAASNFVLAITPRRARNLPSWF